MKDKQKEAKNKIRGSSPAGLWSRTPVLACRAQVYLLLQYIVSVWVLVTNSTAS